MSWSFEKDKEKLAKAATTDAINACAKYNSYMVFASTSCGEKQDLKNTVAFLEMCKQSIDEELNRKIKEVKARMK